MWSAKNSNKECSKRLTLWSFIFIWIATTFFPVHQRRNPMNWAQNPTWSPQYPSREKASFPFYIPLCTQQDIPLWKLHLITKNKEEEISTRETSCTSYTVCIPHTCTWSSYACCDLTLGRGNTASPGIHNPLCTRPPEPCHFQFNDYSNQGKSWSRKVNRLMLITRGKILAAYILRGFNFRISMLLWNSRSLQGLNIYRPQVLLLFSAGPSWGGYTPEIRGVAGLGYGVTLGVWPTLSWYPTLPRVSLSHHTRARAQNAARA